LEEWFLFDRVLTSVLNGRVAEKLAALNINPDVLGASPYTIVSCADCELLMQVVGMTDIQRVMSKKHAEERSTWLVGVFLHSDFKEQLGQLGKGLFLEELDEIHPQLSALRK